MKKDGEKIGHQADRRIVAATGLMIGAAVLGAADTVVVRLLTQDLHPFVIAFFRSLFGLLFVAPWILRKRAMLKTNYSGLHLLRAGLKLLTLAAFFFAIAGVPLADVTAIAFTTPIFVTLGAWIFLAEQPQARRVVAVVIGFGGVLLFLQPGREDISTALLFAVAGAILNAVIHLMLKKMSGRDPTDTLVAWNLILIVPLSMLPAWWFWTTPTWPQLGLLALQGGIGVLNMAAITRAMALADASYVAPIDFLRLPMVAGFAFVFFAETLAAWSVVGAAIIFISTLVMARRARG